jgi:hypothetical protein
MYTRAGVNNVKKQDDAVISDSFLKCHYCMLSNIKFVSTYAGACEYGNELSGSIKCGEFLD